MGPGKVRVEIRKQIKFFLLNENKYADVNKQEQATLREKWMQYLCW